MNLKRSQFVDFYLGAANGNAAAAARMAGYASPKVEGYRLKNAPEVKAEIERLLSENTLTAPEVLSRISDHARGTLEHFMKQHGDEVLIDLGTDIAKEHFHLLKKAKTKRRSGGSQESPWEEVETEIEIHDPQAALGLLARHHKLLTDRQIQEGDPDKPFVVKVLKGVSMDGLR